MNYEMGKYDIIVVGAGHAGCEAALASARMGKQTLLLAINLESLAMMPCNPSIGGTGKGHLVHEIDALGGEMGINIDKSFIQSRMLNTAKGPAVHSLRAQADKTRYHIEMKKTIEKQKNLDLKQGEVVELIVEEAEIKGVCLRTGGIFRANAVILATGTFLGGKIFIGNSAYESGPSGLAASTILAQNLRDLGMPMRRFKTGTPARALASSIDFSKMKEQPGDEEISPFSFMNDELDRDQIKCYLTYTNERTHTIIRNNFSRSALFGGQIEGVGPRYCPSIEDKINRFKDRDRHQLFVEPEGLETEEMYLQGMSTSLPEDVQYEFYRTIPGLENLEISRPGYAIEYDCIDPQELTAALEYRRISGLFCAGQFNGSSGYEEAAAQGLMAGINAVLKLRGEDPFILGRDEAYIGVLIDDLVFKGTNEPYRIMTSRAEYRLLLRQDNADERLTEKSYKLGLATKERYDKYIRKKAVIEQEIERLRNTKVKEEIINPVLDKIGSSPVNKSVSLMELMKRPEITYDSLAPADPERPKLMRRIAAQVEVRIKYEGYIGKQLERVEKFKRMENKKIPQDIVYADIDGLRLEARQKLDKLKPQSLGQAGRISGVSPADINVLLIYLERYRRIDKGE
ncbi:MAG: tRNA uridine-5-carboxymethylaminomethyl(34) synthesis enzyme MnmG [Anaerovoracaceae bacterium]|nr:tRNA uridine-5-carboxymethylaminomethyl(34) synthesis enzyme MnmG [Anaerovoracaceae bacterium]